MITIIAAAALLTSQDAASQPSALVSQMLAKYNSEKTLSGKLTYSQSAADSNGKSYTSHGSTTVQLEKPAKLYIVQTSDDPELSPGRIVSDGTRFVYNIPQDTRNIAGTLSAGGQNSQLVESVTQYNYDTLQNDTLDMGQIYFVGRGGLPLHPAPPLDIAINRHDDLKAFVEELATVVDQGSATINGQQAHLIGGDFRQYEGAPVSGTYQLAITDGGDLLRYVLKEKVSDSGISSTGAIVRTPVIDVTTTWDVDLKVDGQVDENLFKDNALTPPTPPANPPAQSGGQPPR